MKALFFIKEIFRKYPRLLTVTTLLVVSVSVVEACALFTIGPLVDFLINSDLSNASPITRRVMDVLNSIGLQVTIETYLIFFIIFIVFSSCFRIFGRHAILKTKYALLRDVTLGTFEDFFRARWYFFSSSKQGVLLNTFVRELDIVGDAFGAIAVLFAGTIRLIFCLAIPFYISWQVTFISLLIALFLAWPFVFLGKISYRLGKLNTSTSNQIGIIIQEDFSLAKDILGFGNQFKSVKNLESAYDAHRDVTIKTQTISLSIPILYRPFGVIVLAIALLAGQRFGVPLSEIAILLMALLQAVISIGDLTTGKNSLDSFFPSYEQVNGLRERAKQFKQQSGDRIFAGFNKEINVLNLSFAYPNHEPVLKSITMKIPKGKMIAIVGISGAGKSTLIDMIMGFNEPMAGKVTFDGVDLREFEINSYRKRIGYVPQDTFLFNMSIRDNLLWANEEATDQEIRHYCLQANADEFIERFSKGYDTLVGDRGVRLSGGQRQRIALARAIIRKPDLLILDEATSSLDTYSERLIQRAIENIAKKTTIVVIAHRLSTIVNADYVYVLEGGRVIEEGIYSELVKIDSHFNRMVKLQLLEVDSH